MPNRHLGVTSVLLSFLLGSAHAQDQSLENLAQELITLRGEVEELNTELELLKEEQKTAMNSLAAQRADLEATQNRQDVQVKQLQQTLQENQEAAAAAGVATEELTPVVMTAISNLESFVAKALPFKLEERQIALRELRLQLEGGKIDAARAANRLWAFYEDEIRLTRENGLYSQTIQLGGAARLAEVAKLGAAALYFHTDDGQYGQVFRENDRWVFRVFEDQEQIQLTQVLFDSLQKQIRQGYFTLPNPLAALEDA